VSLFELKSEYQPSGDQPQAINALVRNFDRGTMEQTLLGVTGSGKTFTLANVIAKLDSPVLVLSHNKTLAAQLYSEFKAFFPNNAVEYFISYYDYYLPESYIPATDTYIAKDASINENIEKLRLASTANLLERRDTIVVASVSCIYGLGSPEDYANMCYMGKFHFLRIFKNITGSSPIEYRNNIRLEHAKELLTDTDSSIDEISRNLGYNSNVYFCNAFKAKTGMSPSQYRKTHR